MSLLIVISINQLRNAGAHFYSQVTFEKLMLNKKKNIYIYIYPTLSQRKDDNNQNRYSKINRRPESGKEWD